MNPIVTVAQDVALPTSPTATLGFATMIVAAVSAVYGWFRGELNDCKKDRKDLYLKVDKLQADILELSIRVGHCERPTS